MIKQNGDVIYTDSINTFTVDNDIHVMPADGVGPPVPLKKIVSDPDNSHQDRNDVQKIGELGEYEARGHYMGGSGDPVDVYFSQVDIGLTPTNFQEYNDADKKAVEESKKGNSGTIEIDADYCDDIGGWAGNVTYRLKGTITYDEDSRMFEGYIAAWDDNYGFESGDRGFIKETGVAMARILLPGEPYDIRFHGHRDVSWVCEKSNI